MIFLASEHIGEIEPLFDFFPFKKQSGYYIYENLILYINHGKGGLHLAFRSVDISRKYDISIAMLFGYAGCVSGCNLGEIVSISRVKLMDSSLKPIYNPVKARTVDGFKSLELITLLGGFNFDNDYLRLFGELVDREAYFFTKAFKTIDRPCFVFKLVSDFNTRESITSVSKERFDIDRFVEFLKLALWLEKDELLREVFVNTGITKRKILEGLNWLVKKRRYTFTERQKLYKRLIINRKKPESKPFKLEAVFVEDGIDRASLSLDVGKERYSIGDYIPYFHNLKDRVAIIVARKRGELLRKTPAGYTPNGGSGYSILASYNCIYDCSYCFLKGYFKSFNPVVFVNTADYFDAIKSVVESDSRRPLYFYLSTFSDPVALPIFSNYIEQFIEFFRRTFDDEVFLEIRTKSANIDKFLNLEPSKRVIFAFSLSPQSVIEKYEFFTPPLKSRIEAIRKLDNRGFKVGVRFDPVFIDRLEDYEPLIEFVATVKNLNSVEVGFLRFDKNDYKNMLEKSPSVLRGLEFTREMYRYPDYKIKDALNFFKKGLKSFYLSMEY